jgi:mono/diheme cytochrome c family protein
MKRLAVLGLAVVIGLASCNYKRNPGSGNYDPNDPGYRYTPAYAMYEAIPYSSLSQDTGVYNRFNEHGMNMRKPASKTIARGDLSYQYPFEDNLDGYKKAGDELESPFKKGNKKVLSRGKVLYERYCDHCHGKKGKSNGPVMQNSQYPKPAFGKFQDSYIDTIEVGRMYHTITYGKGAMGAHASQVDPKDRWRIIHYIKEVLNKLDEGKQKLEIE